MKNFSFKLLLTVCLLATGLMSSPLLAKHDKHSDTALLPAYPWEYVDDNVKTFDYVVMNFYTDLFDPKTVYQIAKNLEDYVSKNVFPSWRRKISIQFYIPPSQEALLEGGFEGLFINAIPQPGTFIPIILTNDFSLNIPPDFATAVHGNVSGSPTTGYNASLFIDGDTYTLTGPFPFGTPFIVIPAGTMDDGNGISGMIAANMETGQGPTDFYQALSLVMSQEVISTLVDPTAAQYAGAGNPLGNPSGGPFPDGTTGVITSQIFYQYDATAPFLYGDDNIMMYHDWPMTNFALPAYFMSELKASCYDFLGRTDKPFKPYQGNQFVIYQDFLVTDYPEGVLTDLLVGTYVSPLNEPCDITLVGGGSIYSYTGWDMQTGPQVETCSGLVKNIPAVTNSSVTNGRNRSSKHIPKGKEHHSHKCKKCAKSKEPQLLPFQYIDKDGFTVNRFAVVNYIPDVVPPDAIDETLPVLERYFKDSFLPYWNMRAEIKNYTVLPGDVGLPKFDGSFIPYILVNNEQLNIAKLGSSLAAGIPDLNNVPNILAGPVITEYLQATSDFSVPKLPLANPYVLVATADFPSQVLVTTDQPGLGPFTAIPTGSSPFIPTTFPIVALGANADPLTACTAVVNNLTGMIAVNLRNGTCNSLVYPNNMADAGAIAFLTVYDPGAQAFSAPGALIWGATMGADGNALIDALATNPNITITIEAPTYPLVPVVNSFTEVFSHEAQELSVDPNYATYLLTFNPAVDAAVLFSQREVSDEVESFNNVTTKNGVSIAVEGFVNPPYFVGYIRSNNYDDYGVVWRALVPECRQQVVFHFQNQPDTPFNPIHVGNVLGPVESTISPIFQLEDSGSIFDPSTFYPPTTPVITSPIPGTPLDTIYEALMELRDVLFI